jgi:hypothetical protein
MKNLYPYNSALVLTDVIFADYGGDATLGTSNQRNIAYLVAEEKVSDDLETYLAATIVTGTFPYSSVITLDHAHVRRVILTRFIDFEETIYFTVSGTGNVYVNLWNDDYGLVDLGYAVGNCHCHYGARPYPYKVQIVYETGLVSGSSYNPKILMAASTYADIFLNEMIGYGNEGPGGVSIIEFANQEYREKRRGLINTAYGGSPRAIFAHDLLASYRKYRHVGI